MLILNMEDVMILKVLEMLSFLKQFLREKVSDAEREGVSDLHLNKYYLICMWRYCSNETYNSWNHCIFEKSSLYY